MTIDWNKVVFVNHTKLSEKVMHTGVKFIKKEESQTPSLIVKDSILSDAIIPIDNINFIKGEWVITPALQPYNDINSLVDKKFKVLFPIMIGEKTVDYLFTFKITKKVVKAEKK